MKINTKQELYDALDNMNIEYNVTEHKPDFDGYLVGENSSKLLIRLTE